MPRYNYNIVESGVKQHNLKPITHKMSLTYTVSRFVNDLCKRDSYGPILDIKLIQGNTYCLSLKSLWNNGLFVEIVREIFLNSKYGPWIYVTSNFISSGKISHQDLFCLYTPKQVRKDMKILKGVIRNSKSMDGQTIQWTEEKGQNNIQISIKHYTATLIPQKSW